MATDKDTNNELPAVSNFREYLRFKSVHPTPDYEGCVKFLRRMAHELDLPYEVYEFVKGNPIFLLTWEGTDPGLSSIILNSHTDVVPVSADKWKYDPFGAVKETNGAIYGRGTQDMKSVGIQYIEAIRRLKEEGKRYPRTIHLTFMPDEELGGHKGIKPFVKSEEFKRLNAGFALDEGIASPNDTFLVFNAQKIARGIRVSCKGDPGHASQLIQNNAAEKMYKVVKGMREIREEEIERLAANPTLQLSDVITCNLTQVHGGVQHNVIPSEYELGFDIRCPPSVNLDEFEKRLSDIIESAGEGVTFKFLSDRLHQVVTATDSSNPFWVAFSAACEDMKVGIEKRVFHASTDSRFLRELGLPVLGFSPMNNTPVLLHDHDEYLDEAVFLRGIDVYCGIIAAVASVP